MSLPEHSPIGDPCAECGLYARHHRSRSRARADYFRLYNVSRNLENQAKGRSYENTRGSRSRNRVRACIGIDGEGFDHGSVYAYMAAASVSHVISTVEDLHGLSTAKCLDFILDLPKSALIFGFSLGYDYTKILEQLSDRNLYRLCRPELRMRAVGPPKPVYYVCKQGTYALNMMGSRLTVCKLEGHLPDCADDDCPACKTVRRRVVWDVFKFFQSSFITACLSWEVITKEEHETLKRMKALRPDFARPKSETDEAWCEIKRYCGLECMKMAELATKLLAAHEEGGLTLKQYYGAGSTGAAMLEKMGARRFIRHKGPGNEWIRIQYPTELQHAIACAFFGGRFEILYYGPIEQEIWGYDISSAYPYAFTFLPCLVHGQWKLVRGRNILKNIQAAQVAIVNYHLPSCDAVWPKNGTSRVPYGPFPFRAGDALEPFVGKGEILFPVTSGGGWIHKEEFLAAMERFPNVEAKAAWIYNTDCACKVLRESMPKNYKMRLAWGKEGKGIVAKLGQNSCYGKCAQMKGKNPPYNDFVWAGLTTSSCRAQVLRAGLSDHVVMIATDGIFSTKRLELETPLDTGTFDAIDIKSGKVKPLGGWEEKRIEKGLFLIRPGIAFPLDANPKQEGEFKARGISKSLLFRLRQEVLNNWEAYGPKDFEITKELFFGMRAEVRENRGVYTRSERYGTFGPRKQVVSYAPLPKRPSAEGNRFLSHALSKELKSIPYGPALGQKRDISPHQMELLLEREMLLDQPDAEEELDVREL